MRRSSSERTETILACQELSNAGFPEVERCGAHKAEHLRRPMDRRTALGLFVRCNSADQATTCGTSLWLDEARSSTLKTGGIHLGLLNPKSRANSHHRLLNSENIRSILEAFGAEGGLS